MSFITQRGATGPLAVQAGGSFQVSTDANLATLVGTRWDTSDGRELVLVGTASTYAATSGELVQAQPVVSNHQNLTVTAVQAYSANGNIPATVTVTIGATALTANQYQGGFLLVNSGTGIGQTLRIASNPAALSSGTGVVITLEDSPNVALTTSSKVCLTPPYGAGVVLNPTTATNAPIGVAFYPIAASSYGFVTAKGYVAALSDATAPAAAVAIGASVLTAGRVASSTVVAGTTPTVIGNTIQAATSAEARGVFLNI